MGLIQKQPRTHDQTGVRLGSDPEAKGGYLYLEQSICLGVGRWPVASPMQMPCTTQSRTPAGHTGEIFKNNEQLFFPGFNFRWITQTNSDSSAIKSTANACLIISISNGNLMISVAGGLTYWA